MWKIKECAELYIYHFLGCSGPIQYSGIHYNEYYCIETWRGAEVMMVGSVLANMIVT